MLPRVDGMDGRARNQRLWLASFLFCGLFIAEDPAIVAVRTRLAGSAAPGVGGDIALGLVMIVYNFVCARYILSIASSTRLAEAMAGVDDERAERIAGIRSPLLRWLRRGASYLNPFDLIKVVGERLGRLVERIGTAARHRRLRCAASLVGDLGVVNMLGVPGAGLALSTNGHFVSRRHTMRLCILFVASWFLGARLVGWVVGRAHSVPVVGNVFAAVTGAMGSAFERLTDVTQPVGAIALTALTAAVMRSTWEIERVRRRWTIAGTAR
ncbi:MAG: hypothetical protein AB7Q42_14535 [Acidimicrobiia bacterium]